MEVNPMKKMVSAIALIAVMAFGGSAVASGLDVSNCAEKQHVAMCAKEMKDVSECATSPSCPMTSGCTK
jgi:hypothetical protein